MLGFRKKEDTEHKLSQIEKELDALMPEEEDTVEVADHEERMKVLRYALDQLVHPKDEDDIPDDVIRAFVKKIVAHTDSFDWYLRFSPDSDPEKLNVDGKRKSTAKISSLRSLQDRLL